MSNGSHPPKKSNSSKKTVAVLTGNAKKSTANSRPKAKS